MKRFLIPLISLLLMMTACRRSDDRRIITPDTTASQTGAWTPAKAGLMFPDYGDSIVLPPNIAPLNFSVSEKVRLRVRCGDEMLLDKTCRHQVRFNVRKWKRWLQTASRNRQPLQVEVSTNQAAYAPLHWFVAEEPIDPYLVYRLVVPTDGVYNILGIYERQLSDFTTTALTLNTVSEKNCMNCHTFRNGEADEMMVHWRHPSEGTLLRDRNGDRKLVLPADASQYNLRLTYPAYHPQGRYIAFSTNLLLGYGCYEAHRRFFDPGDSIAHIVVYDIEANRLFSDNLLWQDERLLSFPAWSPDGRMLYFCSAPSGYADSTEPDLTEKQKIERIRFDLARIAFDPETGQFGDSIQTLLVADDYDGSFSQPRVNPVNPDCIAVNIGAFSSFPSQTYGNLGLVFTQDADNDTMADSAGTIYMPRFEPAGTLNTPEAESYHCWSRNGRWMVYTGKQEDGYFALPYIAYFNGRTFAKPFLLPQKDGGYYQSSLKSFNLPELTVSSSSLRPKQVEKLRRGYTVTIDADAIKSLVRQQHESENPN